MRVCERLQRQRDCQRTVLRRASGGPFFAVLRKRRFKVPSVHKHVSHLYNKKKLSFCPRRELFSLSPVQTGRSPPSALLSRLEMAPSAAAADAMIDEDDTLAPGKKQRATSGAAIPVFEPVSAKEAAGDGPQFRRVQVPPHRYTPLRKDWMQLYTPLVENLKLDVRMNPRNRSVEVKRPTPLTPPYPTLPRPAPP